MTPVTLDVQKVWDVIVFRDFSPSSNNYIKRIETLPTDMRLIGDEQRPRTRITAETIKAENTTVEVKDGRVRIEGGIVEITRSVETTCQTAK